MRQPDKERLSMTDTADISDLANVVFRGHNVRGAKLVVAEDPNGSHCGVDQFGSVVITIDPSQLAGEGESVAPEHVLAAAAHEVGHALFELENPYGAFRPQDAKSAFFDCLVQDTIIDTRQTRIPALADPIAGLYEQVLWRDDITDAPLAQQFMYGIRFRQVLERIPEIAPEVASAIDELSQHKAANGETFDILSVLTNRDTSMPMALQIARQYLRPLYDSFVKSDQDNGVKETSQSGQSGQCSHAQPQESRNNQQTEETRDGSETQSVDIAEQLRESIEQAEAESSKDAAIDDVGDENDTLSEAKRAELAGGIAKEMNLNQGDAEAYLGAVEQYPDVIQGIAEVFKRLARPTVDRQRMAYTRSRKNYGTILHHDLSNLVLGDITKQSYPFWRQITKSKQRQRLNFGGLDIHLLVDVSGSMAKENKAQSAAATALCLLEGLELARTQVARADNTTTDVRSHIVAFGSSSEELSLLSPQAKPNEKGRMFTNLLHPNSPSTLINEALEMCYATPGRDSIVLAISDGWFFDAELAQETLQSWPDNAYFGQFIIGNGSPLTDNYQSISSPSDLPAQLLIVLDQFIQRYS